MSTRLSLSFTQRSRERIKAAMVETQLIQFVSDEVEMSRTQVYAAAKLLDKVMPNLRAVEVKSTEPESQAVWEMSNEELLIVLYRSPGGKEIVHDVLDNRRSQILSEETVQDLG